jgi:hypothetical protein
LSDIFGAFFFFFAAANFFYESEHLQIVYTKTSIVEQTQIVRSSFSHFFQEKSVEGQTSKKKNENK